MQTPSEAIGCFEKYYGVEKRFGHLISNWRTTGTSGNAIFDNVFSSKYFMGDLLTKSQERQECLMRPLGYLRFDLIEHIYRAARSIMAKSTQGDTCVLFGNSPYLVGITLQLLSSENPHDSTYRNLVFFPFSGSPNRIRANNIPDSRDIVTPGRFRHLQKRLLQNGLSSKNTCLQTLHFIDIVESGGGIAYVMEEIIRDFQSKGKQPPLMHVFTLNTIITENTDDPRQASIAEKSARDGETVLLTFPSKEKPRFRVPATVSYISEYNLLDLGEGDDRRFLPSYNAAYWNDAYDFLLTSPHAPPTKTLLEYFKTHILRLRKEEKSH
ncbi:MAG: hypothetical protein JSS34_06400 [Proteobacteria bacterium]|nr:hypothetical protein [Pseudomonadota bacterium]